MILLATGFIILGVLCALLGQQLFRLLLPLVGLAAGLVVGFSGVQSTFGTGAVSLSVAIVVALILGVIMAALAFMFFDLAVIVFTAVLGATALTYLGTALGLEDNGFVLFLLGLSGAILGFRLATATPLSVSLVISVMAFFGVALILGGVLLLVGDITLDMIQENGIIPSVMDTVSQSLLWFVAWVGGSLVAARVQTAALQQEMFETAYQFEETN